MMLSNLVSMPGGAVFWETATANQSSTRIALVRSRRIRLGYTTCTATYGNGAVTGTERSTTPAHPAAILQGHSPGLSAFFGAARGATLRTSFVVRTATAIPQAAVATSSDFGWYWSSGLVFSRLILSDFVLCPLWKPRAKPAREFGEWRMANGVWRMVCCGVAVQLSVLNRNKSGRARALR